MKKPQKPDKKADMSWLNSPIRKSKPTAIPEQKTQPESDELSMDLQYQKLLKSVKSSLASLDKDLAAVELPKSYGPVLSLDLINLSNSQVIRVGLVEVREDGLSIRRFAEFSLN